jgi:LysM repeat protein
MKHNPFSLSRALFLGGAVLAGLLTVLSLHQPGQAAPAPGPVSGAASATPGPSPTPTGATIALAVVGAPAGAWTDVQWQDGLGQWHDVNGWQAALDPTGQRLWWVGNSMLGQNGLFRWVVTLGQGGPVWATSLVFHLPATPGYVAWQNIYGPDTPSAPVIPPAATATLPPVNSGVTLPTGPAGASSSPGGTYVVQAGDTLYGIALRFQTTVGALLAQNGLTGSLIFPGQVLVIPGGHSAGAAAPANTPAPVAPPAGPASTAHGVYVVQRGDTLYGIALRYGTTVAAIQAANQIYGSLIFVGQTLVIP